MRCKHCFSVFTPNGTSFCSKRHEKIYNEEHALCSYPDKRHSFWVAEDAWNWIEETEGLFKTNLRPFECSCGMLHVGHGESKRSRNVPGREIA